MISIVLYIYLAKRMETHIEEEEEQRAKNKERHQWIL
jgi:hypothetical protein